MPQEARLRYRFTTWAAVLASALLTACERNIAVDYAPGPVAEWGAYLSLIHISEPTRPY